VVLKDIEPDVTPDEVTNALHEKGFKVKTDINILNKDKKPQSGWVELDPLAKH